MPDVGLLAGHVRRVNGAQAGLQFDAMEEAVRDRLIRHLYTVYRPMAVQQPARAAGLIGTMANRLFGADLA